MHDKQLSISNINFVQLIMAKQSSIFNFFTKSPPAVAKTKHNQSPAEAGLPFSVIKSNSSPKEEAKQASQNSNTAAEQRSKALAKVGHGKPFGPRTSDADQRFGGKLT